MDRVSEITKPDILKARNKMAKRPGRGPSGMLSAKSINNHMNILRMLMTEASDRYDFTNPYRNIKPLKLKRVHIEPFSLNEVETILRTVREDYRNYYLTRFYTGMRTGEVDGLKWEYVDFERREILVRETLIAGETEYTKTDGSQREIPMFGPANQVTPELQTELLATIMMTLEEMIPAAGTLLSGPAAPALAPDKEAFVHEQISEQIQKHNGRKIKKPGVLALSLPGQKSLEIPVQGAFTPPLVRHTQPDQDIEILAQPDGIKRSEMLIFYGQLTKAIRL